MSRKIWLAGAVAVVLAAAVCLFVPRLGGFAVILLALGAVAIFAYRLL